MRTDRRTFISTALAGGIAAIGSNSCRGSEAQEPSPRSRRSDYARLDEILKQPVLKRELFEAPVIIKSLELLRYKSRFLCRVRSADGAEGISVGHSGMNSLYPIFLNELQPFFLDKDARDLDLLLEKVLIYKFNFRLSGMAIGIPLATIEFAILDMLGRIANKSMGQLIGDIHHPRVTVYQATEYREKSVEESLELIKRDVAEDQSGRADVHDQGYQCRRPTGKNRKNHSFNP
jgi:L-alanine-DL-glutamate epimerase-like enolase superfamily enzyme